MRLWLAKWDFFPLYLNKIGNKKHYFILKLKANYGIFGASGSDKSNDCARNDFDTKLGSRRLPNAESTQK